MTIHSKRYEHHQVLIRIIILFLSTLNRNRRRVIIIVWNSNKPCAITAFNYFSLSRFRPIIQQRYAYLIAKQWPENSYKMFSYGHLTGFPACNWTARGFSVSAFLSRLNSYLVVARAVNNRLITDCVFRRVGNSLDGSLRCFHSEFSRFSPATELFRDSWRVGGNFLVLSTKKGFAGTNLAEKKNYFKCFRLFLWLIIGKSLLMLGKYMIFQIFITLSTQREEFYTYFSSTLAWEGKLMVV